MFSLLIVFIPIPDFSHFYYMLGGNLGSLLYGDVSLMLAKVKITLACQFNVAVLNSPYAFRFI